MNEVDLKQRAAELERTLQLQLTQLKKDSEIWLKAGGAVLALGLVAMAVTKRRKKKKSKKGRSLSALAQEPLQQVYKRKPKASSLFSPLKKRVFLALFSLGQARLMEALKKRKKTLNEK